jgi:hypothetical protein
MVLPRVCVCARAMVCIRGCVGVCVRVYVFVYIYSYICIYTIYHTGCDRVGRILNAAVEEGEGGGEGDEEEEEGGGASAIDIGVEWGISHQISGVGGGTPLVSIF